MKLPKNTNIPLQSTPQIGLNSTDTPRKLKALEFCYHNFHLIHLYGLLACIGILVIDQVSSMRIFFVQDVASGILTFWMPGYCIVFQLWDTKRFTPILLLPLTLLFSQVVTISAGIILSFIGLLWTPLTILITLAVFTISSYIYWWVKNEHQIPHWDFPRIIS